MLDRSPDCTYRCGYSHIVARPFTPRIARLVTCPEMWYHYMPESGNWHDGTFTRWIVALSAAPATFTPEAAWAVNRLPPNLSRTQYSSPVLTSSIIFRRLIEWFACARLSESHLPRSSAVTFPKRSLPWLFTNAALGGLKPAPASRLRGAIPSSSVQLRTLYVKVRSWRT